MANKDKDFDLRRLDQQIEHPADSLDTPGRTLVRDLQQFYIPSQAENQANTESLQRVQRLLEVRIDNRDQKRKIVPFPIENRQLPEAGPNRNKQALPATTGRRLFHLTGVVAAFLVVLLLAGTFALVSKRNQGTAPPTALQTATQTQASATPAGRLDCSHIFTDSGDTTYVDNGEHALCLQNQETALHVSNTFDHQQITLLAAYADANRFLLKYTISGNSAALPEGGPYLDNVTLQGNLTLRLADAVGGNYYDPQHDQTVYLSNYAMQSVSTSLQTLQLTVAFSFIANPAGDQIFHVTLPVHTARRTVTPESQITEFNHHQLTVSSIRLTTSMTVITLKLVTPLPPAFEMALNATVNGKKNTVISAITTAPANGKYGDLTGFTISIPEDFLSQTPSAWTIGLESTGDPLGTGNIAIHITL